MKIIHSSYWEKKKTKRPEITDDLIEYCIKNSDKLRDRNWEEVWNSISRIPPSGRILKVVYREKGKDIKIITAFWLD